MMYRKTEQELARQSPNTARFFVHNRHVAWVLLLATLAWGVYGYLRMPKRKDPEIPVRVAVAICPWPGASAEKMEQLVTSKIEQRMAENSKVTKIESISKNSVSIVYVELDERVENTGREFDDIKLKLDAITDLPQGAGPVQFVKDFGDTAALMLTVASPKVGPTEIAIRARDIREAIVRTRPVVASRASILLSMPPFLDRQILERDMPVYAGYVRAAGLGKDLRTIIGSGFAGFDLETQADDATLTKFLQQFMENWRVKTFHPDFWDPIFVRDPNTIEARLQQVAGDKYSFRQLDDFTDLIKRRLQTVPQVSKVDRMGLLGEQIVLEYSQERVASSGLQQSSLGPILNARNIVLPGGMLDIGGKNVTIDPSGDFKSEKDLGSVIFTSTASGAPVYLRDLVNILRKYQNPPDYLNFYTWQDSQAEWHRNRAITLAIQMRPGEQIGNFGRQVDSALAAAKQTLPGDLILARTSDQPQQVEENIDLFMMSLFEAIGLVVLVALVGFWEWRSALLMSLSIPITLAMTFGMMDALGLDLQQVSIASLIIALGLLVDDPVVAGDAIKRDLDAGKPPSIASWLGPTKLATAILFATITNIVAYLPFLTLPGDIGRFLYTLPVVITCALIASRIVSMTFIPVLGYYMLRRDQHTQLSGGEAGSKRNLKRAYFRIGGFLLEHRWWTFAGSLVFLAVGGLLANQLKESFFPKDLSYLSYVDVWLPEDATLAATDNSAKQTEAIIRQVAAKYGRQRPDEDGRPREILQSLTTFVGGGGPRFWFSVNPEQQQLNYAQVVVQVKDKRDTNALVDPLQRALTERVPGARVDVRQLESGDPVGVPIAVRVSGTDVAALRSVAEKIKQIYRADPNSDRIRDDWGTESFFVKLQVDSDRANLAGITNLDVAVSSTAGMSGYPVSTLREGNKDIPIVVQLRPEERAQLADVQNLYIFSLQGPQKLPLGQVSSITYQMETEKIRRRNQFRTITVSSFPVPGVLASEVMNRIRPQLVALRNSLPPGYQMEIAGEEEAQAKDFRRMSIVLAISVFAIFLALAFQFRHAVKPFIVFFSVPYGVLGGLSALSLMGLPFGFMAFLGAISLVGVIVSHVIVLFDFVEGARERGEPLKQSLLDAGVARLRPVLITVGATVLGLVPLALHGGPLWEPLCYVQMGGLLVATFVTLLFVPVLYSIFVLDLKLVKWEAATSEETEESMAGAGS